MLGHIVTLCLTFKELPGYFPKWLHHFTSSPAVPKGSDLMSSPPHRHLSSDFLVISSLSVSVHSTIMCPDFFMDKVLSCSGNLRPEKSQPSPAPCLHFRRSLGAEFPSPQPNRGPNRDPALKGTVSPSHRIYNASS